MVGVMVGVVVVVVTGSRKPGVIVVRVVVGVMSLRVGINNNNTCKLLYCPPDLHRPFRSLTAPPSDHSNKQRVWPCVCM